MSYVGTYELVASLPLLEQYLDAYITLTINITTIECKTNLARI
jgi:hypothetical protein